MRTQYSFMLFFLCLNIASYLVMKVNIPPVVGGGVEKGKVEALANQTGVEQVATEWNPSALQSFFGNIISSFRLIVDGLTGVFFGFPSFLEMIGTPQEIVWGLKLLVGFMFGWFLLEIITGRKISD